MGILICGLNGVGKSCLGKALADRLGYQFIDNEDLFFPKTDSSYMFSSPRSKEKAIRSQRVRDRSFQKFGDRIYPGGDLYEKESNWFSLTESRPDEYVTDWLKSIDCPVIRIDGTLPIQQNVDYLVSVINLPAI